MNAIFKVVKLNRKCFLNYDIVLFSTNGCLKQVPRPIVRKQTARDLKTNIQVDPFGWFLLIIPVASFGLGVWQIQRKTWKENLIAQLKLKTESAPIELPENFNEIKDLEFRQVHVRGTFLHDKETYIGPRSMIQKIDQSSGNSLFSGKSMTSHGYLVITPLKLADREETILVNRGWVPANLINPKTRTQGQVGEVVDVIGIVRLNENRPNFVMKNKEGSNLYFYRDLQAMCAATGASPIFLDQTLDYNAPGSPIGGQTRVTLRNEHMSYIITWFSLSAITGFMWLKKFVFKGY